MHVILRLGTLKEVERYPDRFKAKVVRERQEASEGVMPRTYCGPLSFCGKKAGWPLAAPLTSKYLRTFTCATGLKASAHVRQMESNVPFFAVWRAWTGCRSRIDTHRCRQLLKHSHLGQCMSQKYWDSVLTMCFPCSSALPL